MRESMSVIVRFASYGEGTGCKEAIGDLGGMETLCLEGGTYCVMLVC